MTDGPKVVILHVADTVAQIDGTISGTGAVDVFITGTGLAVDLVSAEEGVWLQDGEDVVQAVATVTEATSTTLACRFASLPSDGTYTLVVASRDGQGASAGVSMGKRKVTVRAVATDEEAEP